MRTDHKSLEWLATMLDAHGKRGTWIDMLQDSSFKILHQPGLKHTNVDALSRNLVATNDDDFSKEIQDIKIVQADTLETKENISSLQTIEDSYWFGLRRQ
jgi:hypothetical protein